VTYEYGVVIRRQAKGEPPVWQFWLGAGCLKEHSSFLAVMDWAGARGFEAFAAGNFDDLGVPEVLMKRALVGPPPPPQPAPGGRAGEEAGRSRQGRAEEAREGRLRRARGCARSPSSAAPGWGRSAPTGRPRPASAARSLGAGSRWSTAAATSA
jgi:hypothetical protein